MTRTGRGRKCGRRKRAESKTHSPPVTHSPVSTIGLFFQDPEPVFDERRGGTGTPACAAHGQQCLGHHFSRPLVVPPTLPHIVYRRFFQEDEPVFDQPPGCPGTQPVHCTARSGCATCPAKSGCATISPAPSLCPRHFPTSFIGGFCKNMSQFLTNRLVPLARSRCIAQPGVAVPRGQPGVAGSRSSPRGGDHVGQRHFAAFGHVLKEIEAGFSADHDVQVAVLVDIDDA